jgi:hypothetical protein
MLSNNDAGCGQEVKLRTLVIPTSILVGTVARGHRVGVDGGFSSINCGILV